MPRMVLAHLRRRAGRATALLLGVLIATTGFTVLTSSTATSRLQVVGEVGANFRAAYDILVRPRAERTALEEERGLVRPNFLSGQFGGITMDQYERLRAIPGVEVAAPVAMIGYVTALASVYVDLTEAVDPGLVRQVLRVEPTWTAARGLTRLENDTPQYLYLTRRPVVWPVSGGQDWEYSDGRLRPELVDACDGETPVLEIQEDGSERPLCTFEQASGERPIGGLPGDRAFLAIAQLKPGPTFVTGFTELETANDRLFLQLPWPLLLLLAAIDPAAEADLVGLDAAVTSGRYLSADDRPVDHERVPETSVPVLTTTTSFLDEGVTASVDRLAGAPVDAVPGADWAQVRPVLENAVGVPTAIRADYTAVDAHESVMSPQRAQSRLAALSPAVRSGHPTYRIESDGTLTPQSVAVDPKAFVDDRVIGVMTSWFVVDGGFRPLHRITPRNEAGDRFLLAHSVGTFDPGRLRSFTDLSAVPLETYFPPRATGADERTRELLGGEPFRPDSNPAGYLATPPLMLTALEAFPGLTESDAPLSAIRVRVAGVHGFDPVSRERVRLVAEDIASTTGLDVDITMGSSPAPQTVNLPEEQFGRPELRLSEEWSKKGVAVAVIQATDRKSAVLFGLILVVCVLFLGNAVSAAVRDRRRELAVLACLGWSRPRLAMLIAAEVGVIGLGAGVLSAALAMPLAQIAGVGLSVAHALLAIPVAVLLALLAALVPALRAASTHPARAITATARTPGRGRRGRRRTMAGLAAANMWRVPGRTLLAAAALGIGICAVTVLGVVTWTFHGSLTGTLLGDAVSLRVRGVDTVAVAATVLLGVAAVADVLYLNIRDRAAELAALTAIGWSASAVARLVGYEAIGVGLVGAVVGAGAGVAGATEFAGALPPATIGFVALAAVVGGVLLTALTALIPALLVRRMPVSTVLAEE